MHWGRARPCCATVLYWRRSRKLCKSSFDARMSECIDPVVGRILAGWRYDISGLAPEMRGDYDRHFEECEHCRARRRLHRQIDIGLIVLASLSGAFFVAALVAIKYFEPRHMWILAGIAAAGLLASALVWVLVLISTPAPLVVADAALVVA